MSDQLRRNIVQTAAIFFLVALAYAPTLENGFIWDDDYYVTDNTTLRTVDGLLAIWLDRSATPQYYPLVHTTFWIEYQLWGLRPAPYHFLNGAIHAAAATMLWVVLRKLAIPGAWFCAAVFAVHPVHVESVAWITERKNVLSGLLFMIAFWALLQFREASDQPDGKKGVRNLYFVGLLLFIAALLSKSVTCSLPAAFLLVVWWKRGRISMNDIVAMLPFFSIGVVMAINTAMMERSQVGAEGVEFSWTIAERFQIAGRSLWMYLWKLVVPVQLTFFYPKWQLNPHSWVHFGPPVAALAFLGVLLATVRVAGRGVLAAFLYFGGTLLPALGFFNIYPMRYSFFADHFQYLASIGPIALFCSSLWYLVDRVSPRGRQLGKVFLLFFALTPLTFLSSKQCHVYQSLETLWKDTLSKNPESDIALNNLAVLMQQRGMKKEAYELLRESMRVKPLNNYEAVCNLKLLEGEDLAMSGHIDAAMLQFRDAAALGLKNGRPQFNLGILLLQENRLDEAIAAFVESLKKKESEPGTHYHIARAYLAANRKREAMRHLDRAIELRPGWEKAIQLRSGSK